MTAVIRDDSSGGRKGDGNLEYYLACFPAKPIQLEEGRVYSIGRGDENTIVLPEQAVSRRHALITWDGIQFVVKDCGSSNGTFLNRRKIDESTLKDNDKIGVGGRVFTFMVRSAKSVDRMVERAKTLKEKGKTQRLALGDSVPSQGMAGSLSDFGLAELLQTIELSRKTGKLSLSVQGGKMGAIHVSGGQIIAASFGVIDGEEAVYEMMTTEEGYFEFDVRDIDVERNVQGSTAAILMESFRRQDEGGRPLD